MLNDQSTFPFEVYHVTPGLFCNLECIHCGNASGPKEKARLSRQEVERIKREVANYAPRKLLFTGGEPTFYINELNEIIGSHSDPENLTVMLTTNGWYSTNSLLIERTLGSLVQLDQIQLSFDSFHGSKLKVDDAKRLKSFCDERKIKFNISICISEPLQLIDAQEMIKDLDAKLVFQKVESSGRAKKTGTGFKYPSFEEEVLDKTCPNVSAISYIVGKGHSICCSSLVYNHSLPGSYHDSVENHKNCRLYQDFRTKTFRQILDEKGISIDELRPEHSSPCGLCEYIYTRQEKVS